MKKLPLLLFAMFGGCAVPVLFGADTLPTTTKPATPAQRVTPAKTATPAGQTLPKTTVPPTKPEAKPVEKEEPIVGKLLERAGGGYLNLKVDGSNFVVRFLDAEKKPAPADLARAIVRYRAHLKNCQHMLKLSASGKELRAPTPVVERPFRFTGLSLVLFKEGSETAAEAYNMYFNQPMPADSQTIEPEDMTPEQLQKLPK